MTTSSPVLILDNTLREGEQVPGLAFSFDERLKILHALDQASVDFIDVGIPSISKQDAEFCAISNKETKQSVPGASIRARLEEVDQAAELGMPEIYVMFPFSEIHIERKFQISINELTGRMDSLLKRANEHSLIVNLVAEDASRGSMKLVKNLAVRAMDHGARRLFLCDTVGTALPTSWANLVEKTVEAVGNHCAIGVHCHDDFGMATANTLSAIQAGASIASVTLNGLGERAGNAPLHEVVLGITQLLELPCSVSCASLPALSKLTEELTAISLSVQACGVGRNAFLHESGIHVNAMQKDPTIYEGLRPEVLGRKRSQELGTTTGSSFLRHLLSERGLTASTEQIDMLRNAIRLEKRHQSRVHCRKAMKAYHRAFDKAFTFPKERFEKLIHSLLVEEDGK